MKFAQLINFVFAQPADRPIDHSSWDTCITGDFIAQEVHGDRHSYQFLMALDDLLFDMHTHLGVKYESMYDNTPKHETITVNDVLNLAGSYLLLLESFPDVLALLNQYDVTTYGGIQQVFEYFNHFPQEA